MKFLEAYFEVVDAGAEPLLTRLRLFTRNGCGSRIILRVDRAGREGDQKNAQEKLAFHDDKIGIGAKRSKREAERVISGQWGGNAREG